MAGKKKKTGTVSVMGINFTLEYVDKVSHEGEHVSGLTQGSDRKISVSLTENSTKELRESTSFHELLHAILYVTGQSEMLTTEQEEALVVAVEHGVLQFMDFKPGFLPEV